MMTAGPWRLDALEILRVTRMARFDRSHLFETAKAIVESGRLEVGRAVPRAARRDGPTTAEVDAAGRTRARSCASSSARSTS